MKKQVPLLTLVLLITSATLVAVTQNSLSPQNCKKEKFATAEPGTCLDPKAYRLLKAIDNVEENPYNNEFAKKLLDIIEPGVKKVIDTQVNYEEGNVPVRIYYPTKKTVNTPTPAIFFIHGGGFMYGSIEEYDMAVKKLAKVTDKIIISVDYRLAPEYPYPAALHDVNAVLDWIMKNRKQLGIAGEKITIMGDSAGANLATVLSLKERDDKQSRILCQVLYYPPTTFVEREFPSRVYFLSDTTRSYLLTQEFVMNSKRSYLDDSVSEINPYVSPLEADLTGELPPSLILTAQVDPLRDDGRMYARKLEEAGQEVAYEEYDGLIHGFLNLYMIFPEGKESMQLVRTFIEKHIEG